MKFYPDAEVFSWPDDMGYPYGKKCRCGNIGTIMRNVCTECGADYGTVQCDRCKRWYGKTHDQFGNGCPSCSGLVGYPAEFCETDEYKKEQRDKREARRKEAIERILEQRFANVHPLDTDDLIGFALDLHLSQWRDGLAYEWVEQLVAMLADEKFYARLTSMLDED